MGVSHRQKGTTSRRYLSVVRSRDPVLSLKACARGEPVSSGRLTAPSSTQQSVGVEPSQELAVATKEDFFNQCVAFWPSR